MTILEKANDILDEKDTKIIPGNIKLGVTIFDVTGTYNGPEKTISQVEITLITNKVAVLDGALKALEIIQSTDSVEALGYSASSIDTTNSSVTLIVTNTGTYSVDGSDIVYDENGDQIYPVVQTEENE